jgi:small subunit ribosomal protein S15Ae
MLPYYVVLNCVGVLTKTYLFDLQFGYIVLTTSAGIMDHEEARRKNVGGKVLGFFY